MLNPIHGTNSVLVIDSDILKDRGHYTRAEISSLNHGVTKLKTLNLISNPRLSDFKKKFYFFNNM